MNPNQELLRDALRRLDIAEQALSDARARLRDFERQTADVPEVQPISTPPQQAPAPPPVQQQAQPSAQPQPHAAPPPYPRQAPRPRAPRDREKTLIGAVAVGGALITLAGVAFLVGLAIQAGLLGPVGRVVLAYIVAGALLGAGWWFRNKAAPAGVTALVATSLFAALATTFLVVMWLGWWPAWLGAVLMALIYGGFVGYAHRFRQGSFTQEWMAAGASLAALSYPSAVAPAHVGGAMLVVVLPLVTATYSVLCRSERMAEVLRAIAGIGLAVVMVEVAVRSNPFSLPSLWIAIACSLLAIAAVAIVVYFPTVKAEFGFAFLGLLAPGFLLVTALIRADAILAEWMAVAALAVIVGIAWLGNSVIKDCALGAIPVVYALVMLDTMAGWTGTAPTGTMAVVLTFVLSGLFFAAFVLLLHAMSNAFVLAAWFLGSLIVLTPLLGGVLFDPPALAGMEPLAEGIVLTVALLAGYLLRQRIPHYERRGVAAALLLFVLLLSLLAAVGTIASAAAIVAGAAGLKTAYLASHALVSVAWMVLAARLLLAAEQRFTAVGVLLAIVAVAKLTFFDLAATSGIFRALAFLLSGIILLTIAVRRRGVDKPRREQV
ncbi:hypothetical protein AZH44_02815 [Corynebacterium striatum]|uniref:hypothetical protein n=1 Tax=Corynebacterium striatum TaxID=43770 RepID=UPI000C1CC8D0|nr:hypothetical protein [Corynebacterium striatum]PIS62390.1 hypothetical protein AZH44_02815 [Corynebacterium striatum]PXY10470.1 hypothetical protein CKF55_01095 [Corynebacterium striatum]